MEARAAAVEAAAAVAAAATMKAAEVSVDSAGRHSESGGTVRETQWTAHPCPSPARQTVQDPILLLPSACFRDDGLRGPPKHTIVTQCSLLLVSSGCITVAGFP